jgi:DNA-directed RNA polymerase subunit RPC12/RpoP
MSTEEEDEPRTVITMRLADAPPESAVGGSTRDVCVRCGAAVWVAPTTRALIASRPEITYKFACVQCGLEFMQEEIERNPGEKLRFEDVPGQLEELRKSLQLIHKARLN